MKIIILGAGQVGGTLAESLANEENDITVIDNNSARLRQLQERLDIRTVEGMGSHPTVLKQAGAEDAELLIAVTNSDEVNMVACQVAPHPVSHSDKISRVRAVAYMQKGTVHTRGFFRWTFSSPGATGHQSYLQAH